MKPTFLSILFIFSIFFFHSSSKIFANNICTGKPTSSSCYPDNVCNSDDLLCCDSSAQVCLPNQNYRSSPNSCCTINFTYSPVSKSCEANPGYSGGGSLLCSSGTYCDATTQQCTTSPSLTLIVCVYPKGTPTTGSCNTSGSYNDTFIASGTIKNTTNPSSTPLSLYYISDYTTNAPVLLTTITPASDGTFSQDISSSIQNIKLTSSTSGTIQIYTSTIMNSATFKSGTTNFTITSLAATPTPIPAASSGVNPCSGGSCLTAIGTISTKPEDFVKTVFGILLSLSGGIALLLIIISGYNYMMSQGNPEKVQGAKETLTSAIVGLLFIIFSLVILQVIGVDILCIPGFNTC